MTVVALFALSILGGLAAIVLASALRRERPPPPSREADPGASAEAFARQIRDRLEGQGLEIVGATRRPDGPTELHVLNPAPIVGESVIVWCLGPAEELGAGAVELIGRLALEIQRCTERRGIVCTRRPLSPDAQAAAQRGGLELFVAWEDDESAP